MNNLGIPYFKTEKKKKNSLEIALQIFLNLNILNAIHIQNTLQTTIVWNKHWFKKYDKNNILTVITRPTLFI